MTVREKYNPALPGRIRQNERIENYKGIDILVKPIPEGGKPGDMDPRLFKAMWFMPFIAPFMPKPDPDQTAEEKMVPLRKMFREYSGTYMADKDIAYTTVHITSTDDYQLPIRIYKREFSGSDLPVLIYFHGGGFFGGSMDVVEQLCKMIVQKTDCVVLNVGYRLCPEHHYPQPFEDAWAAVLWARLNARALGGDPEKLSVGGDSAGGTLAADVAMRSRDQGSDRIKLQVLLYPSVNLSRRETRFYHGVDPDKFRRSLRCSMAIGFLTSMMNNLLDDPGLIDDIYLQGYTTLDDPCISPLLGDFKNLPPTLLAFGEHDILAFEDFAYARAATNAGNKIKTIVYEGLSHGFADQIGALPQAEDCAEEIPMAIQKILK
ncbi:MAG: alpha/beta hydrolase [Eubacteriaceae bacterium]